MGLEETNKIAQAVGIGAGVVGFIALVGVILYAIKTEREFVLTNLLIEKEKAEKQQRLKLNKA